MTNAKNKAIASQIVVIDAFCASRVWSEIIELKFGKKMPFIVCILELF